METIKSFYGITTGFNTVISVRKSDLEFSRDFFHRTVYLNAIKKSLPEPTTQ